MEQQIDAFLSLSHPLTPLSKINPNIPLNWDVLYQIYTRFQSLSMKKKKKDVKYLNFGYMLKRYYVYTGKIKYIIKINVTCFFFFLKIENYKCSSHAIPIDDTALEHVRTWGTVDRGRNSCSREHLEWWVSTLAAHQKQWGALKTSPHISPTPGQLYLNLWRCRTQASVHQRVLKCQR